MSNQTPLFLSIAEEENRRKTSIDELIKLSNIVVEKIKNDPTISIIQLKQQAIDNLHLNIEQIHSLMSYINECKNSSYALKTNKNSLIFKESIKFINSNMEDLCEKSMDQYLNLNYEKPTYFYDATNDFGTGKPTFAATALLTILSILEEETHFSNLKEILEDIYDVETSPMIQTVKFPQSFNSEEMPGLEDSFWYYCEEGYEGLVVPTLGYFYGGSRQDSEYFKKEFRAEDCSSSVAKWSGLSPWLNTRSMISAHKNNEVLQKLKPKSDMEVGNILVVGHHTGIVTAMDDDSFTLLSYNRELPYMDGIGYKVYEIDPDKSYYAFEYIDA